MLFTAVFDPREEKKDDRENRILRCEVSERWIQLPTATDLTGGGIDYLSLDVMTNGSNDKPRKICEMIVDRSELIALLNEIPTIDHRGTENE
ncbi:hypothetical protein HQQ92_23035 [Shewanella sp. DC2-4]|uniref:hypothetical protein n=1 Tax=Shewanella sp. DC2-4 TaxID=2739431 RepID=UPI0015637376|nr:hypothetical protein [Shewanella sp. DC2-4]NRD34593.1 hypothetical protein [Shewanella sp. DC2-4]